MKQTESIPHQRKWTRILLLFVLGYEGLGGVAGGGLLVAKPDGKLMDMPVEIMHDVFSDFLIPGIILFGMGVLSLIAFFQTLFRKHNDWLMALTALIGWMIWFISEIIILQEFHWLHIMWGVPVLFGIVALIPLINYRFDNHALRKFLLTCGIYSSLWYVLMNIFIPMLYDGYSYKTFTVSELSAIGAPTRILWVLLASAYPLLLAGFGWGLLELKSQTRNIKVVGSLVIAYSLLNCFWPPMHMRGVTPGLTDTLHISWAAATVLLMLLMMGFGATLFGKRFRNNTIVFAVLLFIFGILSGIEAPNIPIDGPTPMIGVWERINIGIFMIWVVVLNRNFLRSN